MKAFFILVLTVMFTFSMAVSANVTVDVELSPAGSFQAVSKKLKGKLIKKEGKLTADKLSVKVRSLKTGMDLRDKHLKEKLSKDSSKITVSDVEAEKGVGKATILIAGVSKKITFRYKDKGDYAVTAFKLKLSDFGIKGISYMGIGVQDVVTVKAKVKVSAK